MSHSNQISDSWEDIDESEVIGVNELTRFESIIQK
jgi:hypothetical protein